MGIYKVKKDTIFLVSLKAVIKFKNRYLIVKSSYDGKWELPGGLIDENESLTAALKREVKEEVGLSSKIGQPIASTVFWNKSKWNFPYGKFNARIVVVAYEATVT
ncbi:MAG TPA: NUDIX domain-containing protein, partial [Patescibacteria group bacterium]|nr:NUDIX domain-containing protein [Patescibacteria group bacterium]